MNPRQRRGLVMMVVAAVVAVATFFVVTGYVASVNSQVGARVTVYRAVEPIEPYTALTSENLEPVEVPARWADDSAKLKMSDLEGRRIGFRVNSGSTVSSDMLIPSSSLDPTEREIAINVDSVTGVAGRVRPGDRVDIYVVFSDVPGLSKQVRVLNRDVRVVTIDGEQTVTQETEGGLTEEEVIPVTLALPAKDALGVTYASANAEEVRLVALPTDAGVSRDGETDDFDADDLGGKAVPEKGSE